MRAAVVGLVLLSGAFLFDGYGMLLFDGIVCSGRGCIRPGAPPHPRVPEGRAPAPAVRAFSCFYMFCILLGEAFRLPQAFGTGVVPKEPP